MKSKSWEDLFLSKFREEVISSGKVSNLKTEKNFTFIFDQEELMNFMEREFQILGVS